MSTIGFHNDLVLLLCIICSTIHRTTNDLYANYLLHCLHLLIGMLFGDPHFRTFDGKAYTFNGLGEYVLVDAMDGEFVIQIRTAVANGTATLMGTSISAVAAQLLDGDPVQLEFNERFGVTVYIKGTRVSFLEEQEQDFGSFAVVHQLNGTANVTFTNGVVLSVTGSNEILNLILTVPNTFKNHTKGLLGTWNGNPDDDFLTSSGTTLPSNSTEEELFHNFGQTCELHKFCYNNI